MQGEYETSLLTLCEEGTGDENEVVYLLNQPEVNPNVYDEVSNITVTKPIPVI